MTLSIPNLDDRRFQDLVDEAKRYVQQRCPEWTDHNVSDPGVTLIETFALLVDHLIYRMNRIPDRLYVKFLELLGVRMRPPTAARAGVTFWLSAPQPEPVHVPLRTEVSTVRTEEQEAITFTVTEELTIFPCILTNVASVRGGRTRDVTDRFLIGETVACFSSEPTPGDAFHIGLSSAVPSCAVLLRFVCETEGVGVNPLWPPLAWEAWNGEAWVECEIERDETGGLNRSGDVLLHVPKGHTFSPVARQQAAWIRCRVTEPEQDQPPYSASPRIVRLEASTVGGTTTAINAEIVEDEILGTSEGVPAQRFVLGQRPVVKSEHLPVIDVSTEDGWERWTLVESFAESGPFDRHFELDPVNGEIVFGSAVREADGSLTHHGAVPSVGARVIARSYMAGGGKQGNVTAGGISTLKSSIPFVDRVENRRPAFGGVDGEDLESAKLRGSVALRTRNRAITAEDYRQLAYEAAPELARVACLPVDADVNGVIQLLLVSATEGDEAGRLSLDHLVPTRETFGRVVRYLDERRTVGARVHVAPPMYQGVTVVARVLSRRGADPQPIGTDARDALYAYYHPLTGGPDGAGWPFGRPVQRGEVFAVLQRVPGVLMVDDVRLFPADPTTGARGAPTERIDLPVNSLVFSYDHQVFVESE